MKTRAYLCNNRLLTYLVLSHLFNERQYQTSKFNDLIYENCKPLVMAGMGYKRGSENDYVHSCFVLIITIDARCMR